MVEGAVLGGALVLAGVALGGWLAAGRREKEPGKAAGKAPSPQGEKRLEEEQEAFTQLLSYNSLQAYGLEEREPTRRP